MRTLYDEIGVRQLGQVYSYVMETNKGSNNPYHNNYHLELVAKYSLLGAKHHLNTINLMKGSGQWKDSYSKDLITERQITLLIAAALFHDKDHLGGTAKTDDDNIALAIAEMRDFFLTVDKYINPTIAELQLMEELIAATRFPRLQPELEMTRLQKILCDADIIQGMYCPNYVNGIIRGLFTEMRINNPALTFAAVIEMQIGFYKNFKFQTEFATELSNKQMPVTIKVIEDLKFIYKF